MKNWKTSLLGLLSFLPTVLHTVLPKYVSAETATLLTSLFASLGLHAAGDAKADLNK